MPWSELIAFNSYNVAAVPSEAGLYALNDGDKKVIYIGGSDDLNRRLNEHLPINEENPCIKENAEYFQYRLMEDWSAEENKFIAEYNPKCNRT